jgi:hypothetical protein
MRRIRIAAASMMVAAGLIAAVAAPASAATANTHASCSGLAAASRAGDPGAQAETQVGIKAEAQQEGVTPGGIVSGFSQFHEGSAEVCLA